MHHFFIRWIAKNFYKQLSKNAYSCIKQRWTHKCIQDLKLVLPQYKYYLQVDIKSFFMSIDKEILLKKVSQFLPKNTSECKGDNIKYDLSIYQYLLKVILFCNTILILKEKN